MSNVEVLGKSRPICLELITFSSNLSSDGLDMDLIQMSGNRIPKQLFFGQLAQGNVLSQSQNYCSKTH